jgi:hypothetical protein
MGKNTPNNHQIYQMSIKYTNIFDARPSKIYPNLDFWFENTPSGNLGGVVYECSGLASA